MRAKILWGLCLIILLLGTSAWADAGKPSFLIHAKTGLKVDDAQICAVPNVAWAALNKGYEVTILFDASGVTAIKKGGFFGGESTPLDGAALPERERLSLSKQMSVSLETIPKDYGAYLHFLKEKGVRLYANRTMLLLYKIGDESIDSSVIPIPLERMVSLFEEAEHYVAY